MAIQTRYSEEQILHLFNAKNPRMFGIVFRMIYRELFLYADRLFQPLNLSPEDPIQDIFIDIWKRKDVKFSSLVQIRAFCFTSIRNNYRNRIKHLKYEQNYEKESQMDKGLTDDMEKAELYRTLYDSLELIPAEYSDVIRMYLQGWKPEEIATKLNIAVQTVYNRKSEAIRLLRPYISKTEER